LKYEIENDLFDDGETDLSQQDASVETPQQGDIPEDKAHVMITKIT